MNFANNLQFLRKKHSMTQEDLADYLGVSRQSISKWEMGAAYPETDKLIAMCDKFGVTLDELVRTDLTVNYNIDNKDINNMGGVEPTEEPQAEDAIEEPIKKVYEDKWGYKRHIDGFSKAIALGVWFVLLGVSLCCLVDSLGLYLHYRAGGSAEEGYSFPAPIVLLLCVAVATFLFVFSGIKHAQFAEDNKNVKNVFTKEEKQRFNVKFTTSMAVLISAIILDVVALTVADMFYNAEMGISKTCYEDFCAGGFLFILSFIVGGIVYMGMQKAKYDMSFAELKSEHDRKKGEHGSKSPLVDAICGVIMLIATAAFLCVGFIWNVWHPTWVVFPVGGIICGIVSTIFDAAKK